MGKRLISLKIAGKSFTISAESDEQEVLYRQASKDVNQAISNYQRTYSNLPLEDMALVLATNIQANLLRKEREVEEFIKEVNNCEKSIQEYLDAIDEKI